MSSGAAEILGQALKVPVLREIVLVLATFWGGSIALAEGNWSLFLLIVACATGVSAVYLAKFLGRRARLGAVAGRRADRPAVTDLGRGLAQPPGAKWLKTPRPSPSPSRHESRGC